MFRASAMLAALALSFVGYRPLSRLLDDSQWQRESNVYYALHGMLVVVLCLMMIQDTAAGVRGFAVRLLLWFGVFMGAQVEVCGAVWLNMGDRPTIPEGTGMCIVEFGTRIYWAAGFASAAVLARELWMFNRTKGRAKR